MIRNIREIPGDPLAKFANELSKKLSRFLTKDQLDLLDDKEDIYTDGQDIDTVVRVHDELVSTKQFDFLTQYLPPMEPDHNKLTLWIRGRNQASNNMTDWSTFDNNVRLFGDPLLIDGTPFDYGIHTGGVKSLALKFNRPTSPTENEEGIRVDHDTRLMVDNITVGISYFMRIRLHSFAQVSGVNRRLFEKVDQTGWTTNPEDGVMLCVSNAGRLDVTIRRGNTTFEKVTGNGALALDTVHDIWITFDQTLADGHADKIKVYIDNVDKSLSNGSSNYAWRSSTGNTDRTLSIMDSGGTTAHGHTYGDLYDFRIYREKVVSSTEVGRLHTNKWSISNIALGAVLITNYWATYLSISAKSFTSASFTSASFEV